MLVTVIISAYKNCQALRHCLHAYGLQTRLPDQIIIAEDDNSDDIRELVKEASIHSCEILHISQPNNGFGKWKINNLAIRESRGDLLIFTDADCIPRDDFVEVHVELSSKGTFLAGGSHLHLPESFHKNQDIGTLISSQALFDYNSLKKIPGFKGSLWRLTRNKFLARLLDKLTQRSAFSGASTSAFKSEVLAVRGFDESIGYGGGDINLGIRLNNNGVKGRRARHSICYLHLDHPRSYKSKEEVAINKNHNKLLRKSGETFPKKSLFLKDH